MNDRSPYAMSFQEILFEILGLRKAYRAWKQAAKKWWRWARLLEHDYMMLKHYEKLASRRKELLRRANEDRISENVSCFCCGERPRYDKDTDVEDYHHPDCELARELKDE